MRVEIVAVAPAMAFGVPVQAERRTIGHFGGRRHFSSFRRDVLQEGGYLANLEP
jgi:hypothetical protein